MKSPRTPGTAADVPSTSVVGDPTSLRPVVQHLLTVLESERRALARELHDDVGQVLSAIKFCTQSLQGEVGVEDRAATLAEIAAMTDHSITRLRALSARAWPTQLDSLGLAATLRMLVTTCDNEHGSRVQLSIGPVLPRAAWESELALYRIAEYCLSLGDDAGVVGLNLEGESRWLRLQVRAEGPDWPGILMLTAGFDLLRERALHAGGSLEIVPSDGGRMQLVGHMPIPDPAAAD